MVALGLSLGALAARPPELLRLVGLRLSRGFRAVGLDHHQAGVAQQFLGIDARSRFRRRLVSWLVLGLLVPRLLFNAGFLVLLLLLALRFALMDPPLLLRDGCHGWQLLLPRTLAAAPVAAAPVAAAAAVLFTVALGTRLLSFGRKLMKLGRFAP